VRGAIGLDPAFVVERAAPRAGVLAAIAEVRGAASGRGPPWLRASQVAPFRDGLMAVRRFGGVMLALPVGTGKTYVALAIADAVRDSATVTVVAPAVLVPQWRRVAAALAIPIEVGSHEAVSRGRAPSGSGPVIIDESHRFREPASRRYRTIAPVLVGRPIVLATATPIVNRVGDLTAQLRLAVRDDALAHRGLESLGAIATAGVAGLDELVIGQTGRQADSLPVRQATRATPGDDPMLDRALSAIGRLRCSRDPGVAAMVRVGLLRALGSSPAALRATLGRYRRLLDHAARSHGAGLRLSRRALADAIGADPEQLLLWELLPPAPPGGTDIVLGDRRRLRSLGPLLTRWSGRDDLKLARLRALLDDRRPTLVFTTSVETVRYLRDNLGLGGAAWMTGVGAGIGRGRASRATVLAAFDPRDESWPASVPRPWLLLASDVAAEGLNLQRVGRIVHYDLPWTAVRLAQRDGRAIRMGSGHRSVEVVRFELPAALERRIAIERAIERKARLSAGLGEGPGSIVRHGDSLDRWSAVAPTPGWIELRAEVAGALAAVRAQSTGLVFRREGNGEWTRVGADLGDWLSRCEGGEEVGSPTTAIGPILESLAAPVGDWLAEQALGLRAPARGGLRSAIRATRARGVELWRARRRAELERVSRVQRFLSRGHSAGEALLARAVAGGDPTAFARAAELADGGPISTTSIATLIGLVVFRPDLG